MFTVFKAKPKTSTPFSEFIRNAKSDEKKRVYTDVLRRATDRQMAVVALISKAHK